LANFSLTARLKLSSAGARRKDSDIDLAVISPDLKGTNLCERLETPGRALARVRITHPVGALAYSPEEYETCERGTFLADETAPTASPSRERRTTWPAPAGSRPPKSGGCDGDGALEAAVALNYPCTPHQLCVFHKLKNLADHVADPAERRGIVKEASEIFKARGRLVAEGRLKSWARRWGEKGPRAVASLTAQKDRLLLYYQFPEALRPRLKTTNPLVIRELERKFAQAGVFSNARSWKRLTYFIYRNLMERGYAPPRTSIRFYTRT